MKCQKNKWTKFSYWEFTTIFQILCFNFEFMQHRWLGDSFSIVVQLQLSPFLPSPYRYSKRWGCLVLGWQDLRAHNGDKWYFSLEEYYLDQDSHRWYEPCASSKSIRKLATVNRLAKQKNNRFTSTKYSAINIWIHRL